MSRANAWAVFYRIPKGWVMVIHTVRRTRTLARSAYLADFTGEGRTQRSEGLRAEINFKIAPVAVTPVTYRTSFEKRIAKRIEARR